MQLLEAGFIVMSLVVGVALYVHNSKKLGWSQWAFIIALTIISMRAIMNGLGM